MTDNKNFYLPQIPVETIEEMRDYQSKNRPLETTRSADNKLEQKCYRDGTVIIQTIEGSIIDCYRMPDIQLQKMIKRYDEACQILGNVATSARKLRSTGIK